MKKRVLGLTLSLVLIAVSFSVPVFADKSSDIKSEFDKGIYKLERIAPTIGEFKADPKMYEIVKKKEALASDYYKSKLSGDKKLMKSIMSESIKFNEKLTGKKEKVDKKGTKASSQRSLPIYQKPQVKNNYCGYAAIQSLIQYEGEYKSQYKIAKKVYKTTRSCPWYLSNGNSYSQFPVPKYLKNISGYYYMPFPYGTAGTTSITTSQVKSKLVFTIDRNHGLMACGTSKGHIKDHPSKLPKYPNSKISHWLAIKGYKDYGNRVYIVDPAKSSAVEWGNKIDRYYSIPTWKLKYFISTRGLVW